MGLYGFKYLFLVGHICKGLFINDIIIGSLKRIYWVTWGGGSKRGKKRMMSFMNGRILTQNKGEWGNFSECWS